MLPPGLPDAAQQVHCRLHQRRQHPHDNHLPIGAGSACAGTQLMLNDQIACQLQRTLLASFVNLAASHKEDASQAALAGQTERAVQQPQVIGPDAAAIEPDARHFDMLQIASSGSHSSLALSLSVMSVRCAASSPLER